MSATTPKSVPEARAFESGEEDRANDTTFGSGVTIARVETPSFREWEATWRACDYATFFHSPYWAELWQRFMGDRRRSAAERITFSDGRVAILPLVFERKLGGLLSRYTSSPEGTFGGWIAKDPLEPEHADRLLSRLLTELPKSLVWRMNPFDPLVLDAGMRRGLRCRADWTHAVALDAEPDVLLRRFRHGCRDDIRKAMKRGRISVEPARSPEEWRAYYEIYQRALARWGLRSDQGYPWELFECMTNLGCAELTLWFARYDGRIVSGEVCLYARRHVVSWHAATLPEYLRESVAKVQSYSIMVDARNRGFAWYDMNPSAWLPGVAAFKQGFNAKALPAPLVYVDSPLKSLARRAATALRLRHAAFSRQPLSDIVASVAEASESSNE